MVVYIESSVPHTHIIYSSLIFKNKAL